MSSLSGPGLCQLRRAGRSEVARIVGRCGFRCDLCPAYKDNTETPAERERASTGWSGYFGVKVPPEKIQCRGCLADESAGFEFHDPNCPIRPCAAERGLETCASCTEYPCDKLEPRLAGFEERARRAWGEIPQEEYDAFFAPYDARKHLDEIKGEA